MDFEVDTMQYIGFTVIRKSDIPKFNIMFLGEVCSTLINRNIQGNSFLGDSAGSVLQWRHLHLHHLRRW